ncbi:LacI family DNA-binding transcriptional regulator [Rubellicoccus peritrichatus]|uniref:LacI family DNA-binding transcriptional regulator n=1 Tax=Rubellicoccus peritrichatus TaxID=3080537 RepID=A0AAQ3L5L1_9BACT|nr:LacI family DNA-binding transcriptional regulator [Puniceicoccus sp. CR14]WOO39620.1 LacI family DNA-binding transcriptional regulator [Puniceicoccus sp. CR14]
MSRVTLKDIAKKAGVTHATVSMALRNKDQISEKTRERIQKLAKKMGYVPDPMLGRLNAYRTKSIGSAPRAAIGWINFWRNPEALNQNGVFHAYYKGACEMAQVLGYHVDSLLLHEKGMTLSRIESIMHSRNISGILIPPAERPNETSLDLKWERYSVIKFGYSMVGVNSHLITNTQFETIRLAIRKAVERGFKKIGFHMAMIGEARTGDNFLGGYLRELYSRPELKKIEPLIVETSKDAFNKPLFMDWFQKVKPDCILTQLHDVGDWLQQDGIRIPEDVAIISYALPAANGIDYSGVQQNSHIIGQEAVVWLDRLIRHGQRGIPKQPLELLVEGSWVEGKTG